MKSKFRLHPDSRLAWAVTVKLFGRINDKFAWKSVQTWMSDDAIEVVLFPEMKGEVTGYTSGTISLALVGGL